jgi:large subunit ribosomal protein L5
MNRFVEKYRTKVVPALEKEFGYTNVWAVPKIIKVTVNIGASKALKDQAYWQIMEDTIKKITGQRPIKTLSRKAISGFGIREGQLIGLSVTLRREKMNSFLDKLVNVTLPRVKDFHGISEQSVDRNGNLAIGIKEHIVFPEINPDEVEKTHGLEIVIHTQADTRVAAIAMYKLLGFPLSAELSRHKKRKVKKK